MNLLSTKIDVKKLTQGVVWELSVLQDGRLQAVPSSGPTTNGWLRIAPPGIKYQRAIDDARQLHLSQLRDKTVTDAVDAAIRGYALVEGDVLLDWGNLTVGQDPLPFSKEKAIELMSDLSWSNLRTLVESIADNRRVLIAKEEERSLGNSLPESSGTSESPSPTGSSSS